MLRYPQITCFWSATCLAASLAVRLPEEVDVFAGIGLYVATEVTSTAEFSVDVPFFGGGTWSCCIRLEQLCSLEVSKCIVSVKNKVHVVGQVFWSFFFVFSVAFYSDHAKVLLSMWFTSYTVLAGSELRSLCRMSKWSNW